MNHRISIISLLFWEPSNIDHFFTFLGTMEYRSFLYFFENHRISIISLLFWEPSNIDYFFTFLGTIEYRLFLYFLVNHRISIISLLFWVSIPNPGCQGSGGTFFITAEQVLEKVNISKTRLLLKLCNTSADDSSQMETGHCCAKWDFVLDQWFSNWGPRSFWGPRDKFSGTAKHLPKKLKRRS